MTDRDDAEPQKGSPAGRLDPDPDLSSRTVIRELHLLEKISAFATSVLALLGVIGAIIYYGQLRVMDGQLAQMRRSSQQTDKMIQLAQDQQSPWVGIEQNAIKLAGNPHFVLLPIGRFAHQFAYQELEIPLRFSIKNFGSSPALRETHSVYLTEDSGESTPNFPDACQSLAREYNHPTGPENLQSGQVILPSADVTIEPRARITIRTPHRLVAVYVHVCLAYLDARNHLHHSRYIFYGLSAENAQDVVSPYAEGWSFLPWSGFPLFNARAD